MMTAMHSTPAKLHLICRKIASGKSTLAAKLAGETGAVLIAQDTWLGALFADLMHTGTDDVNYAAKLDDVMGPHIVSLLERGVSVVLDFPANTSAQRAHLRDLFEAAGVAHELHVLDVSDEVCLSRLRARNADGHHHFNVSDAQFHRFTKQFSLPDEDEGFHCVRHKG